MEAAVADRLFMGRVIPSGGTVTDAQLDQFLDEVVTPRFPDGFTVFHAQGQWRESNGVITEEQSVVLEVLHSGSAPTTRALEEVAAEYKRRFSQSAVLYTRAAVQMSLL